MQTNTYVAAPKFVKEMIDKLIDIEGRYVNDPNDSGGETKYGITKQVAVGNGYYGDMQDLPLSKARDIYAVQYYYDVKLDILSPISKLITQEVFDTGVNCGQRTAIKMLQRALNGLNRSEQDYNDIAVDGYMGIQTRNALLAFLDVRGAQRGEKLLYNLLNAIQAEYYLSLVEKREKDETFLVGWLSHRTIYKE